MATFNVDEAVPAILTDFSVPPAMALSDDRYPALAPLLLTMRPAISAAVDAAKPDYARRRPSLEDAAPVCEDNRKLAETFDHSSEHTAWGTAIARVLTEPRPDRAAAILGRGRENGNSPVICGAHSVSAVEAGRMAAAAVVAVSHGLPSFQGELDAARREVAEQH